MAIVRGITSKRCSQFFLNPPKAKQSKTNVLMLPTIKSMQLKVRETKKSHKRGDSNPCANLQNVPPAVLDFACYVADSFDHPEAVLDKFNKTFIDQNQVKRKDSEPLSPIGHRPSMP